MLATTLILVVLTAGHAFTQFFMDVYRAVVDFLWTVMWGAARTGGQVAPDDGEDGRTGAGGGGGGAADDSADAEEMRALRAELADKDQALAQRFERVIEQKNEVIEHKDAALARNAQVIRDLQAQLGGAVDASQGAAGMAAAPGSGVVASTAVAPASGSWSVTTPGGGGAAGGPGGGGLLAAAPAAGGWVGATTTGATVSSAGAATLPAPGANAPTSAPEHDAEGEAMVQSM